MLQYHTDLHLEHRFGLSHVLPHVPQKMAAAPFTLLDLPFVPFDFPPFILPRLSLAGVEFVSCCGLFKDIKDISCSFCSFSVSAGCPSADANRLSLLSACSSSSFRSSSSASNASSCQYKREAKEWGGWFMSERSNWNGKHDSGKARCRAQAGNSMGANRLSRSVIRRRDGAITTQNTTPLPLRSNSTHPPPRAVPSNSRGRRP